MKNKTDTIGISPQNRTHRCMFPDNRTSANLNLNAMRTHTESPNLKGARAVGSVAVRLTALLQQHDKVAFVNFFGLFPRFQLKRRNAVRPGGGMSRAGDSDRSRKCSRLHT